MKKNKTEINLIDQNILIDDVIDAITNTINDSNCEDDAKNIINTIINMYVTIKFLDYKIDVLQRNNFLGGEVK